MKCRYSEILDYHNVDSNGDAVEQGGEKAQA